ncbi:hypothetical protein GF420_02185 [candidate division GN15 bacterium]|nr:hypothetical protein [candidate division GN15 bacterium]
MSYLRLGGVLLALLVVLAPLAAQEEPSLKKILTEERITPCADYRHNARRLIPEWYLTGRIDSIYETINFIESQCDGVGFERLRRLLAIEAGEYAGDLCDSNMIEDVVFGGYWWGWYHRDARFWPVFGDAWLPRIDTSAYARLLQGLTDRLLVQTDSTTAEHALLRYYVRDPGYIRARLREHSYPGTCLQETYDREIDYQLALRDHNRVHWAVMTGIWIPLDRAELLGNKMQLGGKLGYRFNRLGVDLSLLFRFLESANEYVIRDGDKEDRGTSFLGGYLGADGAFEAVRSGRHTLSLIGGIGLDGFGPAGGEDDSETAGVNSLNLNIGMTYRLAVSSDLTRYIGVQGRYNVVKYGTGGGSDLTGNTISIAVMYGSLTNTASRRLKELGYYE